MKKALLLFSFLTAMYSGISQELTDSNAVHFPFNKSYLTNGARATLDELVQQYKSLEKAGPIQLAGHCDARGTDDYNDRLSQQRVATVKAYLVQNGIAAEAITQEQAFGERKPRYSNDAEDTRQWNRRVDIVWTRQEPGSSLPDPPEESTTLKEKIDTVREGQTIRLKNINFYGGRHTFLPQAIPALNELLEVMKNNPGLEIEIQGHICCLPSGEDGMDFDSNDRRLSYNRARAVFRYLVDNGIEHTRMTFRGLAGTRLLIYPETSEADRTTNRRVEILITKK